MAADHCNCAGSRILGEENEEFFVGNLTAPHGHLQRGLADDVRGFGTRTLVQQELGPFIPLGQDTVVERCAAEGVALVQWSPAEGQQLKRDEVA